MGQPGLEERTPVGTRVSVGRISSHTGGFWRFWEPALERTQASCAFQVVAAGGKCMLGRSSDKMVPSLKNMGDTRLLASLCLSRRAFRIFGGVE